MTKSSSLWHWAAKSRDQKIFSFHGCFRYMIFWPRWTAKLHLTQGQLKLHCQGHGNHLHKEGGLEKSTLRKGWFEKLRYESEPKKKWCWSSQRWWGGRLRVLSEFSQGHEAKTKVMNDFFPKALAKGSFEKHSPHCQIRKKCVKGDGWWLMAPRSKTVGSAECESICTMHTVCIEAQTDSDTPCGLELELKKDMTPRGCLPPDSIPCLPVLRHTALPDLANLEP